MKKNTKTYLLLGVVALIWGFVGYRVLFSMSSKPETKSIKSTAEFKPLLATKKDTFSIVADYRDPFLGTLKSKPVQRKNKISKPKTPPIPEIPILYTGWVTETDNGKKIFFITIGGQQHLMNINDEIDKVKLLSGSRSSIKIKHNKKIKAIPIKE